MPKHPPMSDLERAAAKAIARDAMVKLENYIIALAHATRNEPSSLGEAREQVIDAGCDLLEFLNT